VNDDTAFAGFMRRIRAGNKQAARELIERDEPVVRRKVKMRLRDPRLYRRRGGTWEVLRIPLDHGRTVWRQGLRVDHGRTVWRQGLRVDHGRTVWRQGLRVDHGRTVWRQGLRVEVCTEDCAR
jgi:hypothetical protein